MLLARYAPPGVLINDKMEILQFRGADRRLSAAGAGRTAEQPHQDGAPGAGLGAARGDRRGEEGDGAGQGGAAWRSTQDGSRGPATWWSFPFTGPPDDKEPLFVVLFEEASPAKRSGGQASTGAAGRTRLDEAARIPRLEHELTATKEYLQSLIEEHGRTNDDLSSANEELVSGNEELQSMNEELETAKEELQSTNEELTTVNDELHSRNQEVTQVNSDLVNLLTTVDIPILILDIERRIRRFTPKARSILNVLPSDSAARSTTSSPTSTCPTWTADRARSSRRSAMKESEVQDRDGRWYRLQIRPYKTTDNKIDGAILSLVDIDALKHHLGEAAAGEGRGRAGESGEGPVPGDALARAADAALQPC